MKRRTAASRQRSDHAKNLVSFLVGDVRYAIEIARVREIVNPLPTVSLPHAPAEVVGVADHRGDVLPVVDLRVRFGVNTDLTRRTKWIIVRVQERISAVALVVDAVTEVFGAGAEDQRSVPEIGSGSGRRGISSVYAYQGGLVFVVDTSIISSAASQIDPKTLPPLLGGGT
ncbi:MAG: chemotaxis protein CheW [Myxococcales bacterium]